jgi:hypothetical protein
MNLALLTANVLGIIIYVTVSSYSWAIPQERGLNSMTGEPLVWAVSVLPIWALFSLLNLIWAAIIIGRRQWRSASLMGVTAGIWLAGVAIDFSHHS